MSELLRTLEEEQLLRPTSSGWGVADLGHTQVPPLVRQMLDCRLAQLSDETRAALELAAVIGQEAPVELWQAVDDYHPGALDAITEEALGTRMMRETSDPARLRFRHALVREAIYESMVLPRRRNWHLRVAVRLSASSNSSPDTVAYHFQQAGDMRAVEWFARVARRHGSARPNPLKQPLRYWSGTGHVNDIAGGCVSKPAFSCGFLVTRAGSNI